ncbi:sensor domain-containing diguanylate cyclase [Pseudidiomarina insulisalsae]|uniref:Sensor domain-containing diguanylate cyclase n=1 Tax=Pseudidiomarina insulisalsae TaxID=575789 RepID=A0A432YQ49_9GAMM|nr:diguanylate cyclase [Pseudidiomarina insulisalsae]RUO63101.1 sensor domain-containing diguanylate cyclase [Pseudidiomarina insulisalsae]
MDSQVSQRLFELAVEQAYDSVLITTAELDLPGPQIVYANDAFCRTTGYSRDEVIGKTPRILQGPLTDRAVLSRLRHNLEHGTRFEDAAVNYRKDGSTYVVHWSISPMRNNEGVITHFVSVQRDITHETQLEHFNQRLLEHLADGVIGIDHKGQCTFVNPSALSILGYSNDTELIGRCSHSLIHHSHADGEAYPRDDCPIHQMLKTGEAPEPWRDYFWTKAGNSIPVEVSATPMRYSSDPVFGGVFIFRDISEQLELERQLHKAASHDQLTGAYNRRFGDHVLKKEHAKVKRKESGVALILADIDHFKAINDELGHLVGDQVLKEFVEVLQSRLREMDSLIRWGGEEFLIVLPDTDLKGAQKLAEDLCLATEHHPFDAEIDRLTASFGVSILRSAESIEAAIKHTDDALYDAKQSGRNCVISQF